jgi:type I restriction enzyme S subunit
MKLSVDTTKYDPAYFYYYFFGPAGQRQIIDSAIQTGVPHTNLGILKAYQVPVPKLKSEQQAIANALGDAHALIATLEALIAKKRDIKQGVMHELLTGHRRLPGFQGRWITKSIGSIFEFGRTTPLSRSQISEEGEVKYIHYGDIHTRLHTHLNFKTTPMPSAPKHLCTGATPLRVGDWVFADASEDYDGVAKAIEITGLLVDKEAVGGSHTFLARERAPTFAPGFKAYLSYAPSFRAQIVRAATGMKVFGISKTQMKEIELHYPPCLEEQRAITAVLSDMDTEIAALDGKLAKARALNQGMMQVLLTGEVRLI